MVNVQRVAVLLHDHALGKLQVNAEFVGRTIPVIGWLVLATDVAQISYEAMVRYNRMVREEDKIG